MDPPLEIYTLVASTCFIHIALPTLGSASTSGIRIDGVFSRVDQGLLGSPILVLKTLAKCLVFSAPSLLQHMLAQWQFTARLAWAETDFGSFSLQPCPVSPVVSLPPLLVADLSGHSTGGDSSPPLLHSSESGQGTLGTRNPVCSTLPAASSPAHFPRHRARPAELLAGCPSWAIPAAVRRPLPGSGRGDPSGSKPGL